MLDTKKVGIKIATFRKSIGLPQEKLAEMLNISPQAITSIIGILVSTAVYFNIRKKFLRIDC